MTLRLSVVVASSDPRVIAAVREMRGVELLKTTESVEELRDAAIQLRPQVIVLDIGTDPEEAFKAYENLSHKPILLVIGPDDNLLLRQALRLGARDYISPDQDLREQLQQALARAEDARVDRGREAGKNGRIIAVMGAKGGNGATFVACQTAAGLASLGGSVAIVDAHLRLGDVAVYLDVRPQYTIASLATGAAVDAAYLRAALVSHASGIRVLAAPQRAEEGEGITAAAIENALGLLRQEVDFLVVDLTRDFDDRSIAVLDRADAILVVTTPEVPALNRASGLLDLLKRLGCSPTSTHVVVNRYGPRPALSRRDLETFLKHTVDAEIPNDYPNAVACANEGRTIWTVASKSALASALSELAVRINGWCGAPLELAPEKPERGLRGLFTRKRHGAA